MCGLGSLDCKNLLSKAMHSTGLEDLSGPGCEEALGVLIDSCNAEADLSIVGRKAAQQHLLDLLQVRLRLVDYWRKTPAIQEQIIKPPLFITGTPKSASTFLHRLLAEDPGNRTPRTWEVMFPLPSPKGETFDSDPRIDEAEERLRWLRWIQPAVTKAHPIGARLPQECGPILAHSFKSYVFLDMFSIPSYEIWLRGQDMAPAYRFHMSFLKHLQWLCPGDRWVLKSSDHVHALATLFQTYPEARVIFLHRDPMRVLELSTSQMTLIKKIFRRTIDGRRLGANEARILTDKVNKIMEFRSSSSNLSLDSQIIDIRYLDLAKDPVMTVRTIYDRFGFTLSPLAEVRMETFVATERASKSLDKYFLGDFGLDPQHEDPQFTAYRERFSVEREPL